MGRPGSRRSRRSSALALAGWVAFTIVPALARRTPLRWLAYRIDYRVTREGVVYLAGIFVVALAALNTGNNLLFMMLACLLAGILISGIISQVVLSGVELRLDLPEHIFAGQPVLALAELVNHKQTLPSFSLRLVGAQVGGTPRPARARTERIKAAKRRSASEILTTPVYFPYLPRAADRRSRPCELRLPAPRHLSPGSIGTANQIPLRLPGENAPGRIARCEAVVYPSVEPDRGVLRNSAAGDRRTGKLHARPRPRPLLHPRLPDLRQRAPRGLEGFGQDRRRCRCANSPAKTSAAFCWCSIRSFRRATASRGASRDAIFERGVALCASLAWHFYEIDSVLAFRSGAFETPMAPAGEIIYDILRHLASAPLPAEADRSFLERTGRPAADLQDHPHRASRAARFPPASGVPRTSSSSE